MTEQTAELRELRDAVIATNKDHGVNLANLAVLCQNYTALIAETAAGNRSVDLDWDIEVSDAMLEMTAAIDELRWVRSKRHAATSDAYAAGVQDIQELQHDWTIEGLVDDDALEILVGERS